MVNKRHMHHVWKKMRPISYWYFLAAFAFFLTLGIYGLRHNNLRAIQLRDHVLEVDKQGGDVEAALKQLREYVYAHMNTDLSSGSLDQPIQLKYSYERLLKAEEGRVKDVNGNVYREAQKYCEAKYPASFSGGPRVPCIRKYVTSHNEKVQAIPDALYKFSFAAPFWSPDLAGLSLVAAAISLLLFIIRFGLERWFKFELDQ